MFSQDTCCGLCPWGLLAAGSGRGYTHGMKTAVSIPDDVFEGAEKLATKLKTSRSQLYSRALKELLARQDEDEVTAQMNRVIDEVGQDDVVKLARKNAARIGKRIEW